MPEKRILADKIKEKGNSYFQKKEYREALKCYFQSINIDPSNAIYYYNRAATYCGISLDKYFHLAISDCEHAIELDPNYVKAYARLAWICGQKGGVTKAIINYQRAINCLKRGHSSHSKEQRLREYGQQMKMCQQILSSAYGEYMFMSAEKCIQVCPADKMKKKYLTYLLLTALGIPEAHIPVVANDVKDGNETLTITEVLESLTMMARALSGSPQMVVEHIDQILCGSNESISGPLDLTTIGQSLLKDVEDESCDEEECNRSSSVDHSRRYEHIERLGKDKEKFVKILADIDENDKEMRSMMGMMIYKYDRAIHRFEDMIKNNEPYEDEDPDELISDKYDCYGWPDELAKRLLYERKMMPCDEGADVAIAEICNW